MSDNRVRARAIFSEGRDTFIDDDKNNVYVISRAFTNGESTEHSAERGPNDDSRSLARKLFRNDLISLHANDREGFRRIPNDFRAEWS